MGLETSPTKPKNAPPLPPDDGVIMRLAIEHLQNLLVTKNRDPRQSITYGYFMSDGAMVDASG